MFISPKTHLDRQTFADMASDLGLFSSVLTSFYSITFPRNSVISYYKKQNTYKSVASTGNRISDLLLAEEYSFLEITGNRYANHEDPLDIPNQPPKYMSDFSNFPIPLHSSIQNHMWEVVYSLPTCRGCWHLNRVYTLWFSIIILISHTCY